MELIKDRADDLYELEVELGEKIIEGITEMPEGLRFNEFDRVWETGTKDYIIYKNAKPVKVKASIVEEGLKVVLPKKMTGKLVFNVYIKNSGIKEL